MQLVSPRRNSTVRPAPFNTQSSSGKVGNFECMCVLVCTPCILLSVYVSYVYTRNTVSTCTLIKLMSSCVNLRYHASHCGMALCHSTSALFMRPSLPARTCASYIPFLMVPCIHACPCIVCKSMPCFVTSPAHELRAWLLHYSPVVLRGILLEEYYQHHLLLVEGVYFSKMPLLSRT